MAKKKDNHSAQHSTAAEQNVMGLRSMVVEQPVTETLENNYMPYAMSVILSRAIPEIDGFKPSHRKLLYTMYKQGLLTGARTKSANIVGATMKLNPHGDAAIYDTMVRLAVGHEALLHPFVDSKGNFGKFYSTNMEYAAYRYTEAKLAPIASELFRDIDKDTVDFVDNYDSTTTEPTLFPVTFPSILVNNNLGIAVGMASQICSFNLSEVCETTIALMKNPDHNLLETMPAPDFPGGGTLIYDPAEMEEIYKTGRGSFRVRSNYAYDKDNNCIDVTEIPYTTNLEAIIAKVTDLVKLGKIKEINDIRNETGKAGLKITIDLKRGVDPDKLMNRLFALTPLEDSFSCNFNVLCGGMPQVLGVRELLDEWTAFRTECVRRRTYFDLSRAKEKLHLLKGLQKILLDIDKAVAIVRSTDEESEVVPNLMIGFGIDQIQAEYVAEIKLRHFNREYILKRLTDIEDLEKNIADMEDILKSRTRVRNIIIDELKQVAKKYGQPRRTQILYAADVQEAQVDAAEEIDAYPCTLFFTKEGYFKKIQPNSLRMSSEHKFKENDSMLVTVEATNAYELLFFSTGASCYKAHAYDFADTKASVMGDFVATKLSFDAGETAIHMVATTDFSGYLLFFFENGKVAKVPLSAYDTKSNRKKLVGAYSDKSPLVAIYHIKEDGEFLLSSTSGRRLLLHSGALSPKTTRNTQGVQVMTLKGAHRVEAVVPFAEGMVAKPARYRTKNIPAAGATLAAEDVGEQLTF